MMKIYKDYYNLILSVKIPHNDKSELKIYKENDLIRGEMHEVNVGDLSIDEILNLYKLLDEGFLSKPIVKSLIENKEKYGGKKE